MPPRSNSSSSRRHVPLAATLLAIACASPASAQKVTVVPGLTARQVLVQLGDPASSYPVGEAIALTSATEIATAPFGTSSGGFVFKLDPATGLLARTTTTFGPSFTERAMTSGEGKVSVGATFNSTTLRRAERLLALQSPAGHQSRRLPPAASRTGTANLDITAKTLAISATARRHRKPRRRCRRPAGQRQARRDVFGDRRQRRLTRLAETNGSYSGIGDLAAWQSTASSSSKVGDLAGPRRDCPAGEHAPAHG